MVNSSRADSGKQVYNRLIKEKSPYLLQHSANPVDWFPWGDEAFEKAERDSKPIFLSIGYSTCHWCHVMEHESFEDPEVARLMNQTFVCVKVDREERPEIDNIYMTVCQLVTGSGGWPLTIVMTPDKKPFFAGTYIPRESRFGQVGLLELIPRIREIWEHRRDEVLQSAEQMTQALAQSSEISLSGPLEEPVLKSAFEEFQRSFDARFGGFGRAPKFPTPHNLLFLLRYWLRSGENSALRMVESTLQAMRSGGIYDHVGFGFHRYSTDQQWLLPHFEKMLYDQALMAIAYTEACQATGNEEFRIVAKEIFSYVVRDMTDIEGAFFSAEDADSEGQEGRFYLWNESELRGLLSAVDADLLIRSYDIDPDGNYDEPSGSHRSGLNILHLARPVRELADRFGISENDLRKRLEKVRQILFAAREKRVHPFKDDKILTDWNGLMIAALALGAQAFGEHRYADAARKAADFIMGRLRRPDGRLLHRYRDGEAAVPGNLDDYAFMIWGLLNLYEATFEVGYLSQALALNETLIEHFWDGINGAFYFTADDSEELPIRAKNPFDGAVPSGNSVAALNLIRLARMTGNVEFETKAEMITRAFSSQVRRASQAFSMLLSALDFALGTASEVVIVGAPGSADTMALLDALRRGYIPNKVVIFRPTGAETPSAAEHASFVKDMKALDDKATAYVCRNHACDRPVTDPAAMLELLRAGQRN